MLRKMVQQRFVCNFGGAYTAYKTNGRVYMCETHSDHPPAPVVLPDIEVKEVHPIEIAFPRHTGSGTLVVKILEEWNEDVWRQFPGWAASENQHIFEELQKDEDYLIKLIRPPRPYNPRIVHYKEFVCLSDEVGLNKIVEFSYERTTRSGG